jgi:hypothetical protein
MDRIWETIIDLRPIILTAIAAGAVILVVGVLLSDKMEWTKRRMKFFGIFYGLNARDHIWLSSGFLRLVYVVAIVLFAVQLEYVHMLFYMITTIVCVVFAKGVKLSIVELVNSVAIYAALMAAGIIFGYYTDVSGNPYLFAAYWLLGAFAALYTLYFYIRGIGDLMLRKIMEYDPESPEGSGNPGRPGHIGYPGQPDLPEQPGPTGPPEHTEHKESD